MSTYTMTTTVELPHHETVNAVRAALGEQGFGILTEIDLAATLKDKLEVDMPPHVILGACRPVLAHAAIESDRRWQPCFPATWLYVQSAIGAPWSRPSTQTS
jgi:uncharacterized protein (DUF302 family)